MIVHIALLSTLLGGACRENTASGSGGQGRRIESASELRPSALPGARANLLLRDITIPVKLQRTRIGDRVELALVSEGRPFEVEVYKETPADFQFLGVRLGESDASGDFYEPPITLLKFPMTVGDLWEWTGNNISGAIATKGTAKIRTSADGDLLKVQVDIELDSGGPKPALSKRIFWFAPNRGVIKREFGQFSTRTPPID